MGIGDWGLGVGGWGGVGRRHNPNTPHQTPPPTKVGVF